MEKTYFISFEGIDGCGKDTQLHELVRIVKEDDDYPFGNKYSNIWVTREPTKITKAGNKIAKAIRERDVSGEEATFLFIEDRKEHSQIIRQMLRHSHVFTSRYDISTLAYQMTQGMDFETLYNMHEYESDVGTLMPDITLVFDLPVEVAFERMGKRVSKVEIYEKKEFQEKLKMNLNFVIGELRRRDGRKILIVNANQPIEQVTKEMVKKIADAIK